MPPRPGRNIHSVTAAPGSDSRRRGARFPGYVNLALALGVIVVIIPLALSGHDAPPAIAEFAPQAQRPIAEAPPEQTSALGHGAGGGLTGAVAPASSPTPPQVPGQAIVLHCVGDPPRQIDDPQSPPCVPYWLGNNGGSTYHGVSPSVITIASGNCSDSTTANHDPAYQTFFNSRFELYGRKIRMDCSGTFPGITVTDAPTNRSYADYYYSDGDFGSLYDSSPSGSVYYYEELAKKGMVASSAEYGWAPESWLRQYDPYIVQYEMASDRMFANLGEWACDWLAGRPPSHAGPVLARAATRKFGIYFSRATDSPAGLQRFHDALSACGITVPASDDIEYSNSGPTDSTVQSSAVRFNADNVTTVFCLANDDLQCPSLMNYASGQSYFPEWVMSTYGINDRNWAFKVFGAPEAELRSAFGLTFTPRQIISTDEPWWWAAHEGDPTLNNPNEDEVSWQNSLEYHSWLMLAAGIQMAGPHLTAQTFMRGLQQAVFPNPYSPNMEGAVDLLGGNHSWTTDAAVWWWSSTARSPYSDEQAGTVCYVDHGARTADGAWRKLPAGTDPLFAGVCDSGSG